MLFGKRLEGQSILYKHPLKNYVITTWRLCVCSLACVFVRVLKSPPPQHAASRLVFVVFGEGGKSR